MVFYPVIIFHKYLSDISQGFGSYYMYNVHADQCMLRMESVFGNKIIIAYNPVPKVPPTVRYLGTYFRKYQSRENCGMRSREWFYRRKNSKNLVLLVGT